MWVLILSRLTHLSATLVVLEKALRIVLVLNAFFSEVACKYLKIMTIFICTSRREIHQAEFYVVIEHKSAASRNGLSDSGCKDFFLSNTFLDADMMPAWLVSCQKSCCLPNLMGVSVGCV